jgi:hypothetical protein
MEIRKLESQLKSEGFTHTFVWQDGPNTYYPDHTHNGITAHIILDGEMELTTGRQSKTYKVEERCDVGAGEVHSAKIGPNGCRYLIGEM